MAIPSIPFIHSRFFCVLKFYDTVADGVKAKSCEIRAFHLPNVGLKTKPREGEPPTMCDDAASIAKETEKPADEDRDVILVAHSYGGVPMTESSKGSGKEEKQRQGKKGRIVNLAYLTASVRAVGSSAADVPMNVPRNEEFNFEVDGWLYAESISVTAAMVFSELPKDEGEAWAKKMPRHSAANFAGELTYAGYKDIPASYLLCEDDPVVPPESKRGYIRLIEKESGNKVDVTSVKTGHAPNVTAPQEVINWILDVAGKAGDSRMLRVDVEEGKVEKFGKYLLCQVFSFMADRQKSPAFLR